MNTDNLYDGRSSAAPTKKRMTPEKTFITDKLSGQNLFEKNVSESAAYNHSLKVVVKISNNAVPPCEQHLPSQFAN